MMLEAGFSVRRGGFNLQMDLAAGAGDVVALLGPNGSGKTTALHALAGLLPIDSGRIVLDAEVLDDPAQDRFVVPERRPVSLVFQDYLLFPHLSARDNVAFGIRAGGTSPGQARREAEKWLGRFGLAELTRRKPRELSGGQAQRVALARALATSPSLLLLDEPLAALDAETRIAVRRDLREHLTGFGGGTIMVTHDPLDALALASRVIVLDDGRVTQTGGIADLSARPRSRYVADLVGLNLLTGAAKGSSVTVDGTAATLAVGESAHGEVFVLVHPHAVALYRSRPDGSPRNTWRARIEGFDLLGDRVRVRTRGPVPLVAEVTSRAVAELELHEGDEVWVGVKATEIATYPR